MEFPPFLAAFRSAAYRTLWTGAFLSSLGTWTQDVALSWLIHTQFVDPRHLGYRSFAADAPLIAFMLLGGAAADRVDRRRILIASQLIQMGVAVCLGLLYVSGRLGLFPILLFAFLNGLAQSQSAPTYQAVLTTLVPPHHIPSAVALNSLQFNMSRAIGPVLGGLLLVRAGTGWCFAANVVSFFAIIVALARIQIPSPRMAGKESLARSLAAGLDHVRRSDVLFVLMALAAAASFLAFPLVTYLPVVAGDVLGTGARGYSQLLASFGAGAISGAVVTAHRGSAPRRGRLLVASLVAYGLTTAAAVLTGGQLSAMALLFLSGGFVVSGFSILNSLMQEAAPDALRGRVVSIYGLAFRGGMPLGSLVAGFLVKPFGAPIVLAGFSLLLAGVAGAVYVRNDRLRNL
jgi:MFS family permease